MRFVILVFALTLSNLGFSQSAPGTYADPFPPLVSTPSVSFATPALQVGARNATEGNVAGAGNLGVSQNSTAKASDLVMSLFTESSNVPVAAPVPMPASATFNTGASIPQDAFGVARLTGGKVSSKPAVRTFTNADLEQTSSK